MGRLAELLDVSVASATGIVSRMEKRGLVVRRHDEDDRRVVVVERSDAAEQIFRGHRRTPAGCGLTRLLDALTDDELSALLTGHRALKAARAAYMARTRRGDGRPKLPKTRTSTAPSRRRPGDPSPADVPPAVRPPDRADHRPDPRHRDRQPVPADAQRRDHQRRRRQGRHRIHHPDRRSDARRHAGPRRRLDHRGLLRRPDRDGPRARRPRGRSSVRSRPSPRSR